tara:strand:- start:3546 stop:3755 length:210 start_codon:yes stop_codon:yes gene_type:complete
LIARQRSLAPRNCDVCGESIDLNGGGWVILASGHLVHHAEKKQCSPEEEKRGGQPEAEKPKDDLDWLWD